MKIKHKTFALLCSLWPLAAKGFNELPSDPRVLINTYTSILGLIEKHEGSKQAIAYAKACRTIAVLIATGGKFEPVPFRKSNKQGVPRLIQHLVPLLNGNPNQKRYGLTICDLYKSYHLKPSYDTSSITDEGVDWSKEFDLDEFSDFSERWIKSIHIPKLSPSPPWHNPGGKKGPNGPALLTSHWDMVAAVGHTPVWESLNFFAKLTNQAEKVNIVYRMTANDSDYVPKLGKLAFLSERGGKTRVIAIGDYYTQQVLKPLHNQIMEVLKNLETDGTWNQDMATERIRTSAVHPCFSYDLTSATDRFPRELIKVVLSKLWGNDAASHWITIMTDRDFQAGENKVVKYKVGQPMGLYTSWAAFALTHHALIQYLAWKEGFKSFSHYSVLGDDVAIWNNLVAARYKATMEMIGVKINLQKSLCSEENHLRIEFAKRIFYNGVEISPLGFSLLEEASRSLYNLPMLFSELKRRGWELSLSGKDLVPGMVNQKGFDILFLLSKGPFSASLSGIQFEEDGARSQLSWGGNDQIDFEVVKRIFHRERCKSLEKRALELQEEVISLESHLVKFLPKEGYFFQSILYSLESPSPAHAAPFVLRDVEEKCWKILKDLHNLRATEIDLTETLLTLWEYVPTPLEETLNKDLRVQRNQHLAKLWLHAITTRDQKGNPKNPAAPVTGGGQSIWQSIDYSDAW